jgi:hypothetical protein
MASAFAASAKWPCLTPPATTLPVKPAAAFAAPVPMPLALTLSPLMITGAPSPAAILFLAHVTDPVPLLASTAPSMSSQPPAMLIIASFQPLLLPMLQIVPTIMMVSRMAAAYPCSIGAYSGPPILVHHLRFLAWGATAAKHGNQDSVGASITCNCYGASTDLGSILRWHYKDGFGASFVFLEFEGQHAPALLKDNRV